MTRNFWRKFLFYVSLIVAWSSIVVETTALAELLPPAQTGQEAGTQGQTAKDTGKDTGTKGKTAKEEKAEKAAAKKKAKKGKKAEKAEKKDSMKDEPK